jgi:hypothetical protein
MLGISDQVADDSLREKARKRLEQVLDGDDEGAALRAATALYSYRAAPAPEPSPELGDYAGPLMPDGKRPVSLGDVLAFAMSANASTRAVAEAAIAQAEATRPAADKATHPAKGFEGVTFPSSTGTEPC